MASTREFNYFPNASNTTFSNFTITHASGNTGSSERNGLRRLLDNISEGAFHDAAERGDPPKCHPHTRVAIRTEIMEWISAPEARLKFILWMYGPAGSGKTAIGQSIAEECRKKGLLAASFFFSRTAAGRNDTKRVVATIAYQISLHLPQIQDHLFTAIERDPTIFSRALATQMQVLIVEPLKALPPLSQPIFVILDGLDEAGPTSQDQANLLNVIGTATSELQHLPLIFLVASRPEYEIREAFNGQLSPLTQSLVLDDTYKPDDDIRLYLTSTFEEIRGKQVKLGTELPSPWPSESDVDRLVSKASGQFIFAATVLKFIDSIRHHPAERLDIIFGLSTPGNETPFALLDALYSYILSSAEEPAKVLQIFTALVLTNPNIFLRDRDIEQLLDLDVRRVLVDMHALISVPAYEDHTTHLKFHHASLSDFLMDRLRSHKFYISASQGHIDLTRHWWKAMSNSQFPGHDFSDSECLHHFIYHCTKSPAGIELIGDLARFDLKELLKEYCRPYLLMYSPWKGFFECIKQQAGDREDISRRIKAEFDAFILDHLSNYPPALQTHIPTIFSLSRFIETADIIRLLLCDFTESVTECDNICELDFTLFYLKDRYSIDDAFFALFQDKFRAGKYYVCDRSYLALANQITRIIFPKSGEDDRQIKFEKASDDNDHDEQVLYLADGSLRLRLYDPEFFWFPEMLLQTPNDLDLAMLLREHALQYDGHDIALKEGRENIACGSLEYIKRCGIPFLDHVHPQGTSECIICEDWKDTFKFEDPSEVTDPSEFVYLDWQNDPQEDAAKFISSSTPEAPSYASEIGAPPNEGTSNIVDLGWQNDPRVDTAVFFPTSAPDAPSYASEVGAPPNDLDEERTIVPIDPDARPGFSASSTLQIFGNSSSTLSSNLEASSVVELPAKLKRKRGELGSESRRVRVRQ